ncbi:hypothetical protein NQ176_g3809 [Zarea fungicola]|uniref:Uncharacterized protein n=1 Tax=Zarea fungicola TaxID=93591 RepID=A0ACC1NGK0_9HYPO|nr:hypothetical protein NQ176_g3809 [Lecanicillium fungicola]
MLFFMCDVGFFMCDVGIQLPSYPSARPQASIPLGCGDRVVVEGLNKVKPPPLETHAIRNGAGVMAKGGRNPGVQAEDAGMSPAAT